MRATKFLPAVLMSVSLLTACGEDDGGEESADTTPTTSQTPATPAVTAPVFDADSAYAFVAKQVGFGPRTPGSAAQKSCADWMEARLRATCDTVYVQRTTVKGGDGKSLPCINLVGAVNPQAAQRILLLAHWDSRPWADMEPIDKTGPVDGADDGASGVGVLLEVARVLKSSPLPEGLGVDILLVDVEDYGKTEWGENSYGLGTQYWAANPHVAGYRARYGILLDMVGGRGARFPQEDFSRQYAPDVVQKLWSVAGRAGYSSFFPYEAGGAITDDHTFVNRIARIPTIDVIHLTQSTPSGFPAHWHTRGDNMSVIDRATLKAVGQSLLQLLAEEGAAGNS